MGRCEVRSDISKNRLYVTLDGYFTDNETKEAADRVIMEVNKLKPGFDIINNISTVKPTSPKGTEDLGRAIQYLADYGIRRAIRIVPSSYFAASQFSRVSSEIGGYDVHTASSMEEAERMLDGKV
ncbi:MAG: hypothetical protein SVY10_08150 [Thermodesulfobacteriota bacterium]|nr:hypothetical protein [Thermodesulfobacteriota bacterium]